MINLKSNIKDDTNLVEYMRELLANRPEGVLSADLVRDIFMLTDVDAETSRLLIENLMEEDEEFLCDETGRWFLRPSPILKQPLSDLTFVIVDLETTGGGTRHHRIIEIGAVL